MFIPLIVAAAIVFYIISVYNNLQTLKTQIAASIQEIGNQLKRQAALIPNLEAATKGYLKHEKGVYELITQARTSVQKANSSGASADIEKAINQVQSLIPQINVTVESNPELKADQTIGKFMAELSDTADKLMYARRTIIDLTQAYNEKLVVFPSNLVAQVFGFKSEAGLATATTGTHLEVSETETKDHKVNL
ncbi:MAG TPA: LemA family protein [Candidatus Pacebacteria bacterium]|nr:LemA family protein [Candidatus Paceibacterota bacterium]